jgi:type VI secretion system protein ImpL
VIGPQRFLLEYGAVQAAQVLQERWEAEVMGGVRGVDKDDLPGALFDEKEGLVWKFVAGTGKPFISRNQSGYCSPRETEARIPLREEFFSFLNTGPKSIVTFAPSYVVTLEALPIEVNSGAKVKPYGCVLSLLCGEKSIVLENYNYPQKQTFEWAPDQCGDTSLTILLGDLKLTRAWEGKMGFAECMADFYTGSHTFTAEDFPRQREALEKLGVSGIKVSFKTAGSHAVARLLERNPSRVPLQIVAGM